MTNPEGSPSPSPFERENAPPQPELFDAGAMTDDQIIVSARAYYEVADIDYGDGSVDAAYELLDALAASVRNLASRDPERIKAIIDRLTDGRGALEGQSDVLDPERQFAAAIVPGLIDNDYIYTRNTLGMLLTIGGKYSPDVGFVQDAARREILRLKRDRLTPEQSADFDSYLDSLPLLWEDEPYRPLKPEDLPDL